MREKGRNPANQLSGECIVAALTQLLQEKTLSEISISELAKRAGVPVSDIQKASWKHLYCTRGKKCGMMSKKQIGRQHIWENKYD